MKFIDIYTGRECEYALRVDRSLYRERELRKDGTPDRRVNPDTLASWNISTYVPSRAFPVGRFAEIKPEVEAVAQPIRDEIVRLEQAMRDAKEALFVAYAGPRPGKE